ncbi:hypothetical protein PVK06_009227 [Gossypium arboreum]|uniref:Uncharacterized protein n=1 Tax=Gossypium arboreum TaxID=29729 RepID=A0ABR0QN03_GOSAR|nr:hypothetical protein PVK06_009227 [Gossypium arboreum]
MDISLENDKLSKSRSADDRETKKVQFKEGDGEDHANMVVDLDSLPKVSWKQMLMGKGVQFMRKGLDLLQLISLKIWNFFQGDVKKSIVNGISAIEFSDRIQQLLFKDMEQQLW